MAKKKWFQAAGIILLSHLTITACQGMQDKEVTKTVPSKAVQSSSHKKIKSQKRQKQQARSALSQSSSTVDKAIKQTDTPLRDTSTAIPGVTKPTSDGFILTHQSKILSHTKTGIVVEHNGHSHFIFYADLQGTAFEHLIPSGATITVLAHLNQGGEVAKPKVDEEDHYVFNPADIVAEDEFGYTVAHGDHYHYIPKPKPSQPASPSPQPSGGTNASDQVSSPVPTPVQSGTSAVSGVAGLDYPTSDGFLFDGSGIKGWTTAGLIVDHGGHLHLLLKTDLAKSKWAHLLSESTGNAVTPPATPVVDELAVKRTYLATATGLSEDQLIVIDTPNGKAFMYPHGDHHHVILLSQLDPTKPFDDGHSHSHDHHDAHDEAQDKEEAQPSDSHEDHTGEDPSEHEDETSDAQEDASETHEEHDDNSTTPVATDTSTEEEDSANQNPSDPSDDQTTDQTPTEGGDSGEDDRPTHQPEESTQPEPDRQTPPVSPVQETPLAPLADEVASKRRYLATATNLLEDKIVLLTTPNGPAFMYPHGDHHHVVLLSQLDINQPFNDAHDGGVNPSTSDNASADLDDKIAEKVAAIMRQYGLKREDIVVDKAKNAIIYPHGNHFHADPIDPKKPHSGGHSHSDEEIFDPEDGVAEKTDHKVLTGEELAKAIQLLQANTFNNQAFTVDRGQKRVSFIFNDSIVPQLGTNVRVTLTTPDGKVLEKLSGHVFGEGAANLANFELDKPYLPGQTFSYTIASKDYPEVSYSGRFAVNASPAYDLARGVTFEPFYAGDGSVRLHATRPVLPGTEALVRLFDDFHGAPYLENNYQTGSIELAIPELNKGTTQLPGNTIPVVFIVNPYELNESSYVIELPVLDRQTAGSDVFQPLEPGEDGLDDTVDQPSMEVLQDKLLALAQKYGVGLDSLIFHPDGRVELRLPDGTYLPVDMAGLIAEAATEQETPPTKPGIAGIDYPTSDGFLFDGTGMAGWTSAGLLVTHKGHTHILPTEAIAKSKWAHLLPKAEEVTPTAPVELSEQLTKQRDDLAKQLGLNVEDIRVVTADGKVVGFEYPHEDHYDFVPANTSDGGSTELTEQDKRELTAYIRKTYGLLMGTPVTFHDDFVVFAIPHPHQDYDATRDYYSDVLDPQYDPGHVHPYAVPLSHLTVPVSTGIAELDFENELLLAAKRIGVAPSEVHIKDKKYFVLPGKDHDHYLNILTPHEGYEAYHNNKLPDIKADFLQGDYSKEAVVAEADRLLAAAVERLGEGTVEFRRVARVLEAFKTNLTIATTSTEGYVKALQEFEKRYITHEWSEDTVTQPEVDQLSERYTQLIDQLKGLNDRTLKGYDLNRDTILTALKSSMATHDEAAMAAVETTLRAVARVESAPSDLGPRIAYLDYFLRHIDDSQLDNALRERISEKVLELYQTVRVFRTHLADTAALKAQLKAVVTTANTSATVSEIGNAYHTLTNKRLELVNYVNGFRDFLLKGHGMSDEEKADGFTQPLSTFFTPVSTTPVIVPPSQPSTGQPAGHVGQPATPDNSKPAQPSSPASDSETTDAIVSEPESLEDKATALTHRIDGLSAEAVRSYRVPVANWKDRIQAALDSQNDESLQTLASYLKAIERIEHAPGQNDIGSRMAHLDYFLRHIDKPYVSSELRERLADKILYLHTADSYEYQRVLFEVIDLKAAIKVAELANQTYELGSGAMYNDFLAEREDVITAVNYRRHHLLARGFITETEKAEGFTEILSLP